MGTHEETDHEVKERKIAAYGTLGRGEAVGFIENLLERFRQGEIVIRSGNEEVTLTPGDFLDVEVKVSRKGGRQQLSLELSWKQAASAGVEHSAAEHAEEGETCVSEGRRRIWEAEQEQDDEIHRRFVTELLLGCELGDAAPCSAC